MMTSTPRLLITLAVVAGASALILAGAYNLTKAAIDDQERNASAKALTAILFADRDGEGNFTLDVKAANEEKTVLALFRPNDPKPVYYAATGAGSGYNPGVPIRAIVVFTNPEREARTLLAPYLAEGDLPAAGEKGVFLVGFRVVASAETPGLGEKIRDTRPTRTWADIVRGRPQNASPDSATDFQRQFRGRDPRAMRLKKDNGDLDVITGATVTTRGLTAAFRDARRLLAEALGIPETETAPGSVPDVETHASD